MISLIDRIHLSALPFWDEVYGQDKRKVIPRSRRNV
jgi:hypothetical protein